MSVTSKAAHFDIIYLHKIAELSFDILVSARK